MAAVTLTLNENDGTLDLLRIDTSESLIGEIPLIAIGRDLSRVKEDHLV